MKTRHWPSLFDSLRRRTAKDDAFNIEGHTPISNTTNAVTAETETRLGENGLGGRTLPRPAVRWLGPAGRIALRPFDWIADADAVCSWQEDTYTSNFPDFRYTSSFANAFRHDLRRASLDPNHGLFVLDEGQLVGFMWLVICENNWTGERYGYVNNLYIAQSHRGQRLGHAFIEQSDVWFRARRIRKVRLTVTVANEAACRLYQSCGYDVARWEMEKEL